MARRKVKPKAHQAPSLLKVMLFDFFVKNWLVSLLAIMFLASAMMLAYKTHETRNLTAKWKNLRKQNQQQKIQWDALRLELSSLSEADRISNLARSKLGMKKVDSKTEKVISL